jgi:hypothetical protein
MENEIAASFYVHLDSANGLSKTIFPDNRASQFQNILKEPLFLTNKDGYVWKVALANLIVPNGIYNIPESMTKITHNVYTQQIGPVKTSLFIPPGFYDPYSYADAVNRQFRRKKIDIYDTIASNFPALYHFIRTGRLSSSLVSPPRRQRRGVKRDLTETEDVDTNKKVSPTDVVGDSGSQEGGSEIPSDPGVRPETNHDQSSKEEGGNEPPAAASADVQSDQNDERSDPSSVDDGGAQPSVQSKRSRDDVSKLLVRRRRALSAGEGSDEMDKDFVHPLQFHFDYDSTRKQFVLSLNVNIGESLIIDNDRLRHTLGCATLPTYINQPGPLGFTCNMNRYHSLLFVTSDILDYTMVSNQMIPLLRVVPLEPELTQTIPSLGTQADSFRSPSMFNPHFERLEYYPITKHDIKSIGLTLSNETGSLITLDSNTRDATFATLHFVQIKTG